MASSPSSSSPRPATVGKFTMSNEDVKAFHAIDRDLYTRLIFDLGRDLHESMHTLAFWLWLERVNITMAYIVRDMLVLPDPIINMLAEEATLCLKCISADPLDIPPQGFPDDQIPLTQNLTRTSLTLNFLHACRDAAIPGITSVAEEVGLRVVDDIAQRALQIVGPDARPDQRGHHHQQHEQQQLQLKKPFSYFSPVAMEPPPSPGYGRSGGISSSAGATKVVNTGGVVMNQEKNNEVGDVLSQEKKDKEGVDARTIFLTFSRGYPIREDELIDFLTRKFGDCIESVQMQDVAAREQPLYAKLVLHTVGAMQVILEGKEKAKFAINGKHVWARKYVFNKNPVGSSNLYWEPGNAFPPSNPPAASSKPYHQA